MKIACICNLNHAQFILARYLRDAGHQVTIYLMEEYANFHPQNDAYGIINEIEIRELPWKHKELYKYSAKQIREELAGYDFYCGSEFAPAFVFKAGIPLDIYIPIGTDLIDYPVVKWNRTIPDEWEINEQQFHLYQLGGIRFSKNIFMNLNGDEALEKALQKVKFRGTRHPLSLPYLYLPEYEKGNMKSALEAEITRLKGQFPIMFISHNRCEFTAPDSAHNKGTGILIEAFAAYLNKTGDNACLVMMEYGNDVDATKELIQHLGIQNQIRWIQKTGRKDIIPVLQHFNAGIGNLFFPTWSYNVAMEILAAGIPLIQKGPGPDKNIYPYYSVNDKNELADALEKLAHHQEKESAITAKRWIKEFQVEAVLKDLMPLLQKNGVKTTRYEFAEIMFLFRWNWYHYVLRLLSKIYWRLGLN